MSKLTSQSVTVFNPPTIDGGSDSTICEGDSVQVTATGGVSYDWVGDPSISDTLSDAPYLSPTSTMMYTVVGEDANGCIDTGFVTITVNPEPVAPTISRLSCDSITSNFVFGNQWVQNGFVVSGANDAIFEISNDGDYWIIYTDNNGCTTTSDTLFVRDYDTCLLSVDEITQYQRVNIYPNPANSYVTIEYESEIPVKSLSIISSLGEVIRFSRVEQLKSFSRRLDLGDLSGGVYFIQIDTDKGRLVKRIMIE